MVFPVGGNQFRKTAVVNFEAPNSGPMFLPFCFYSRFAYKTAGINLMPGFYRVY